ncbi:MAG: 3'-5' exonuclease, partial [Methanocorpusculum sp.]|nr:3'-5' exonuclease [Methanocorpusculum sp.]
FIRMMEVCIRQDLSVDEASAEESSESSETGGDAADKGAVKLMTIHASKGLEFPVTVLMYCDKAHSYLDKALLYDRDAGCVYTSLTFPGEKEKVFGFISLGIKQKALALEYEEHQRLFYVGMTRAQDYLLLVSTVEKEVKEHSFTSYFKEGSSSPAWDDNDVQVIDRLVCAPQTSAEGDSPVPEIPSWWTCRRCAGTAADAPDETDAPDGESPSSDAPDPYILKRGSCIHEIFEGRDPEVVCRKYSLMQEREKFTGYLAAFMDSEVMQDADVSWCELPLCSAAGEFKRCDRLVRKKDGSYVIVDYKSGKLSALSDDMREKYVKQLTGYSEILSPVLGADAVPAYLYFAGDNAFLRVV